MTIHPQAISWLAASAANTLFKHSLHHPFPIYTLKREIMSIHEFPIHLRLKYVDSLEYQNFRNPFFKFFVCNNYQLHFLICMFYSGTTTLNVFRTYGYVSDSLHDIPYIR